MASKEFIHAVVNDCHTYTWVQCSFCGKKHACDKKHGGMYKEGEWEGLHALENLVIHDEPVEYGIIDNAIFIAKCDCDGGDHYENFMINNRDLIARFFINLRNRAVQLASEFGEAADAAANK